MWALGYYKRIRARFTTKFCGLDANKLLDLTRFAGGNFDSQLKVNLIRVLTKIDSSIDNFKDISPISYEIFINQGAIYDCYIGRSGKNDPHQTFRSRKTFSQNA